MIFPIGDDNVKGGFKPIFSYIFIGLNVLVFLYQFSIGPEADRLFVRKFGTIPSEIINGQYYFTLLTSMFLHGGWMHLIGNMLFLWVFADNIEAKIGNIRFVLFYIMGGLAASAAHIFFNMESVIPAVGASGAISAVLGAYMVMFPKSRIKVLVVYIFSSFHMAAVWFLGLWIGQQLISGIGTILPQGEVVGSGGGVAWWAHIGGFAFGVLAGFLFKSTRLMIENNYDYA